MKAYLTCDNSNLLYVVVCPTCSEEYTGETGIGKSKLRDRVQVHRQHIRQPQYQKLKAEVVKVPLKYFLRCEALRLNYPGAAKETS